MRRLLVAAACALLLSSCGSNPLLPQRRPPIETLASPSAVTIPEGVAAGDSVTVYVSMVIGCPWKFDRFEVHEDSTGYWTVDPILSHPDSILICLAIAYCRANPWPLRLRVPTTGVAHYRIAGERGTLSFVLGASAPVATEHRVTFLHRESGLPYAALPFEYLTNGRPDSSIGSATTDSTGTAVLAPPPCPARAGDYLELTVKRGYPCGDGVLLLDPYVPLCDRALHTIAFF